MASLFTTASASFITHPLNKLHTHSFVSSSPPPPPPQLEISSTETIISQHLKMETSVETTEWVASSMTRRFGIGAGLAWAAFLAFEVVSDHSQEEYKKIDVEKQEEIVLPNGVRYYELRVGSGATPCPGDLVVIDLKGQVQGSGKVFVDTFESKEKRALSLVMGSRPYSKGICEGLECVLRSMKAGGKRRVIVPPSLGFGVKGAEFGPDLQIPPSASLEYIVEVDNALFAPA